MLLIELVHNIALLLALTVGYDYLADQLIHSKIRYRLISGLLFGAVAVIGMLTPMEVVPGVIYDGRSIVLAVAGYVGGPVVAGIAAVIAAAYRAWLGGAGMVPGLLVIAEAAALGALVHHLRRSRREDGTSRWERPLGIWLFGIVVHVLMMAAQLFLPTAVRWEVLALVGPAVVVLYPIAQLLIITLILDREERRRAQQSLKESEERYHSLFENSYAPMLVIDPDSGRIVDANGVAAAFYGWSTEELRTMRVSEINVLPSNEIKEKMERARGARRNYFEVRHRLRDGSIRDVAVYSGTAIIQGRERLYSIIRDLSEQRELEKQVHLLSYSTENAAIAIYRISEPDGRIIYANRRGREQLGYSKREILSFTIFDIDPTFDVDTWLEHRRIARRQGARTLESVHRRKDGTEFPVELTVTLMTYAEETYSFTFAKDISERQRARTEILRSLKEKDALLREVHHRVKNNLATIGGLIRLQLDEVGERLETVDHPALKALVKTKDRIVVMGMVHNMLYHDGDLSRIDLAEFIEQLVALLIDEYEVATLITTHLSTTDVTLDVEKALPVALVANEAVTNTLTHALRTDASTELAVTLELTGSETCRLMIRDTGPGLGPDFRLEHQSTLGFRMMSLLAQQIDADLSVETDGGTAIHLSFTV
jgi:PAS domain S-box-containing protein